MEYFGTNKYVAELKDFIERKKDTLKMVAIPALVIAAVLFFWFSTCDDSIEVEADTQGGVTSEENISGDAGQMTAAQGIIYVDIGGEVLRPGVYEVEEGTRLFQVIEKAGGLTEDANIDEINRAETVFDGQKIMIGDKTAEGVTSEEKTDTQADGKININTADSATLQEIPGIGPSKADRIIQYRESEGRFKSIDDIKNISGIGNKTFESIKEYITV